MASAAQQETRRRVRYQVPSSPRERRPEDGGDRGDGDQRGAADDGVHERAYGEAQPVGHRPSIFHARLSRSVYVCPAKVRRAVL
jgi:hypothetical protein